MAEYSKEYCEKQNVSIPYDFSYKEIANDLDEGETIYELCEGFGTIGVTRVGNELFLISRENELVRFHSDNNR